MWYFFPTLKCNLNCKMCFAKPRAEILGTELSYAQYTKVIDFLIETGYRKFEFAGGEPLLKTDIWEICAYIHERGGDLNLSTNGTLIGEFLPMFEKNYFQNIEISLDAPVPFIHNTIRRSTTFERTLSGIKTLAELKEKGKTDFSLGISSMLLKDNVNSLDRLPEFLSDMNVDYLCIQTLDIVGNGVDQIRNHVLPSDYLRLIIKLLQRIVDKPDMTLKRITVLYPVCFSPFIQGAIPFERFEIDAVKLDVVTHDCNMFTGYQALTPSGEVTGCCIMVGLRKFYSKNITELAGDGPAFKRELDKRRNTLYERIILDKDFTCNTCTFFHACKGGCRASAYSYYGDISSPDPRCVLRGELRENTVQRVIEKTRIDLNALLTHENIATYGIHSIDATNLD